MAQKKFLSNAGLEHYDGKIKEYIGDHSSNDIVALKEESPATSAHSIGDYISYNHIVYEVIDDISVDDLLIVDSNIEVATLEEGTVIYSDDEQGSTSSLSYNDLGDKPQINNVELASGNNSLSALGIQGKLTFDNVPTDGSNNPVKSDGIYDSEKDIYAVMGEMGAKNLIPYPWYGPSNNESGLTFTDNGDGSLTIDGTATRGVDWIWLSRLSDQRLIKGGVSYNFTIEVVEGTISKGHISVFAAQYAQPSGGGRIAFVTKDMDSNTPVGIYNNVYTPTGAQITASPVSGVYATLYKDTVFNNFKIRVMLRLASDTDDTYQQYAKTNKQLTDEIANKVDKVEGKGLSENDYTDADKAIVGGVTEALAGKVDKVNGKGLSTNDFDNTYKSYATIAYNMNRRTRNNITSNLTNLSTAVSEQNLGKYGYTIGDYFTGASGYTYILADCNTFKGTITPYCISTNHIGIVVDTHTTSQWHTENAAAVGYNGSTLHTYLKTTVLDNIKADFKALFGGSTGLEHLIAHNKLLTTATANWAWQSDQYISALTCTQVDAGSQWTANGFQEGEASKSLEVFRKYKWTEIFGGEYPWLRNISNYDNSSASCACLVDARGCLGGDGGVTGSLFAVGLINFY